MTSPSSSDANAPSPAAEAARARRLRAAFEHAVLGVALVDRAGRIVEANPALERMLGYAAGALPGASFEQVLPPTALGLDPAALPALWGGTLRLPVMEREVPRADGQRCWTRIHLALVRDEAGTSEHLLAQLADATLQRRVEAEFEREQALLDQLFETSPAGLILGDAQGRILRANAEFTRLFGYTNEEALGRTPEELITPDEQRVEVRELSGQIAQGGQVSVETVRRHKDGHLREVSVSGTLVPLPNGEVAAYVMYQDIAARKAMERALREASITDPLTGLANRRGFFHLAEREWKLAGRRGEDLLLLYLDVDNFKEINDRFGHAEGDQVLRELAALLQDAFRTTDVVARLRTPDVVARLGGDEFVVLAIGAAAGAETLLAARLREALARYNAEGARPYSVSLSLGMVRHSASGAASIDELLAAADHQMYAAKRARA